MTTLPNMSIVLPTLGADIGTWDDKINAALTLVDAHDHKSGKGLRINTTAIEIDADLTIAGYALTNVGKAAFTAVTALASGSKTFFVSSADNELYWRSNGGTNIQVTSGSTLNISLVGGIAGDYTSVGAEVAYDDSNDRYTFKQEGTKPWARIACGPVRIFEYNTLETVYVELAVDAALASSYTITLPAAVPGAAALVQISAAGVVSFSNTTTGTITAGALKYTTATTTYIPPSAYAVAGTAHVYQAGGFWAWGATGSDSIHVPIHVTDGETLTGFTLHVDKNSDATNTITAYLQYVSSTGAVTTLSTVSNAANAPNEITLTAAFTHAVVADSYYEIYIFCDDGTPSAVDKIRGCKVTRTRP